MSFLAQRTLRIGVDGWWKMGIKSSERKGIIKVGRIIKGYWDCPYCEEKDIDGLVDYCPKCGVHKPEDVKYHLPEGLQTGISYALNHHVDKHMSRIINSKVRIT